MSPRIAVVEQELVDNDVLVRKQHEIVNQLEGAGERLAKEVEEKNRFVEKRRGREN